MRLQGLDERIRSGMSRREHHERLHHLAARRAAATRATQELELAESEFLPFAASWPQLRTAYLGWLRQHEASGARFERAEGPCEVPLGALRLVGRIVRIDLLADRQRLVIDYKSEARETTQARIRTPMEDTQGVLRGAAGG